MKIIIVGCGKVGRTLAEQLTKENHDIVVVEKDPEVLREGTARLDVLGVEGNGASITVLEEAGVREADLLIAVASEDELNLLCCLIAKKAGAKHTIARVRNPEYSREIPFIKDDLGLSMTINPEQAAAMEMVRLLRFPSAIKVETFAKGRVELLKMQIPENSVLDGKRLYEAMAKLKAKVLVCAVEREGDITIPSGEFMLRSGDRISIVAPPAAARQFFKRSGVLKDRVENVLIIGGGKISYYLAKSLLDMHMRVKIVEKNAERCLTLSERLPDATIVEGDGTDQQLLKEEGIEQADAFVSLTDIDEENILLSLYAGSCSGAKLITKVNWLTFENIIGSMPVGSTIYPKMITAEYIIRYVRAMQNSLGSNVQTLYRIVSDRAEALEFRVRERTEMIGVPLEQLRLKKNLLVSCINRGGTIIIPGGKDTIEIGDTVIVVTTNTGLSDLHDILA